MTANSIESEFVVMIYHVWGEMNEIKKRSRELFSLVVVVPQNRVPFRSTVRQAVKWQRSHNTILYIPYTENSESPCVLLCER